MVAIEAVAMVIHGDGGSMRLRGRRGRATKHRWARWFRCTTTSVYICSQMFCNGDETSKMLMLDERIFLCEVSLSVQDSYDRSEQL